MLCLAFFAKFVPPKTFVGVSRAGRLAKLSTAEIWKIDVKWITSRNVHVLDIYTLHEGRIISVRRGLCLLHFTGIPELQT